MSYLAKVGFITIGQSPRVDVMCDLLKLLPSELEVYEIGALDDLSYEEIENSLKPKPHETVYVTRLRDGREVKVSKERIIPLVNKCIRNMEDLKVDVIGILCSGEFPQYNSLIPIVYPEKVLKGFASSISCEKRVAILIPIEEQKEYAKIKWGCFFKNMVVYAISPYTSSLNDFLNLSERLEFERVKLVIMDCIGYSLTHKNLLKSKGNFLILTTRTVLAKALCELLQ